MNLKCEELRQRIRNVKSRTNKAFAVNLMMANRYMDEIAKMVIEEGVPILTTGGGDPEKYMESWIKEGIKVIPVVANCKLAKKLVSMGAHALVAEGNEAGGHVGHLTTMTLIPLLRKEVDVPIIAAGGITSGKSFLAALILGADGVQMGTRFITSKESNASRVFKEEILKANDRATLLTGFRIGHPVRSLKSPYSRTFQKIEYLPDTVDETLVDFGIGSLKKAVVEGNYEEGNFMCGIGAGLIDKEESVKDIIDDMMAGLYDEINKIKGLII